MKNSEVQICRVAVNVDSARLESILQGIYCVEFCLSGVKSLGFTADVGNNKNVIQFKQTKTLNFAIRKDALQTGTLELHLHIKNQPNSDNQRKKDQLIGSLSVPLSNILIQNKYSKMEERPLQYSSLNSFISFSCECIKGPKEGIVASSIKDQQNSSMQVFESSYSPPSQQSENLSPSSRKSAHSRSWEELLVHQASFFTQQNMLAKMDSKMLEQRIEQMEKVDLQILLKDNYRLERLLYISRNERKIESGRHQQELKDMARQLSLREAEIMQLNEELDNANDKIGQLLDEFSGLSREKEELEVALNNEKTVSLKLQSSHDALSARVKSICDDNQLISKLKQQLSQASNSLLCLQEQLQIEKQRVHSLQFHNEQLQKKLQKSLQVIEQMEEQIKSKDEMVNICKQYEERLSELQQKIDCIEGEGEFVHRISYSSYEGEGNQIRIEEDENSLRRIIEEELEQSLSLEENVKISQDFKSNQIFTATTLLDPQRNELELLQLLTQNLQRQYDQFKMLYRVQEEALSYKHKELHDLEKQLANMRYEFLLELSHVTALMNQQILENRQLRDENFKLKSRQQDPRPHKVIQKSTGSQFPTVKTSTSSWQQQLVMSSYEKDELKQRCRQLQEDNQVLLKYNLEREELYEMMMAKKSEGGDLVVQRFENALKYILEHRQQYGSLLRNYGFCQQSNSGNGPLADSQQLMAKSAENSVSEIINNFHQKAETQSQIHKFDVFKSQSPQELLIQSTARGQIFNQKASDPSIQTTLSELIDLTKQRQNTCPFGFKKDRFKEEDDREKMTQEIKKKIQKVKTILLRQTKLEARPQWLQPMKDLEVAVDQYCLT